MSGGVWLASYVVLWAAVAVLLVIVLALVRQIGVLHTRLDGAGAGAGSGDGPVPEREPLAAAEGPPLGSAAPMPGRVGYERAPLTLVAFVSASCELSQVLAPALRVVDKQYEDVRVVELPLGPRTIAAYEAFNVLHTPFMVAVGRDGRVRGRGRARNLQQLEAFVERALAVAAKAAGVAPPPPSSRVRSPAPVVAVVAPEPVAEAEPAVEPAEPVVILDAAPDAPAAAEPAAEPVEAVEAETTDAETAEADPARAGV